MKTRFVLILMFLTGFHSFSSGQDFWEEVNIPDSLVMSYSELIFSDFGTVFLGTLQGLFKSEDDGITWEMTGLNSVASLLVIAPDQTIFTITDCKDGPCLKKSMDYGNTWINIHTWDDIPNFSCSYISSNYYFMYGALGGIFFSGDTGLSWNHVFNTTNVEVINDIIEKDSFVFAGSLNYLNSQSGGVSVSIDSGFSWAPISLPGYGVSSLAIDFDNNLLCGINYQYSHLEFGVLRSYDNGSSWSNILNNYIVNCLVVDCNGGIYAGCDNNYSLGGIQFLNDNGISWAQINSGLHPDPLVSGVWISPRNFIFLKTESPSKLYRSANPIVQIKEKQLQGNTIKVFPNPCENYLRFKSKKKANKENEYKIKIIDPLGKEFLCVTNHFNIDEIFTVDVSSLIPGIYFAVIIGKSEINLETFIKL